MKVPKILLKLESPGSSKIRNHMQFIDKKMEGCWRWEHEIRLGSYTLNPHLSNRSLRKRERLRRQQGLDLTNM